MRGQEKTRHTARAMIINARIVGAMNSSKALLIPPEARAALVDLGEHLVEMAREMDGLVGVNYGE